MKIQTLAVSAIAAIGFSAAAGAAPIINFDQDAGQPTGHISYDGNGGALIGKNISFSYISANDTPKNSGNVGRLNCADCMLNFETGANNEEGPKTWTFGSGGTFSLTGTAIDQSGNTIASGALSNGTFSGATAGQQKFDPDTDPMTVSIGGFGTADNAGALVQYFGLSDGAQFVFSNTVISLMETTFGADGSFSGDTTGADLNQAGAAPVLEPQEWAMFGLGVMLVAGGLAFRRKTGCLMG